MAQRMKKKIFKIHKYELNAIETVLHIPADSVVLSVQNQYDKIVLWAKFEDVAAKCNQSRCFRVVPTGGEFVQKEDEELKYIATVQVLGLVWHVFEVRYL